MDQTILHFEIPANKVEKLRKFYAKLFGWKIEKMPDPVEYSLGSPTEYWTIETAPAGEKMTPIRQRVCGGLYKKKRREDKPVNYVSVESIDKYIQKVKTLEGTIIQQKQQVTGVGWTAIALDPEGNQVALFRPTQNAR